MKFWPFPLIRNYPTCPRVDGAVRLVLSQSDLRFVRGTQHHETYASSEGELTFWAVNRFYAYASEGLFKACDGTSFHWKDAMPSRSTVALRSRASASVSRAQGPLRSDISSCG